ncbi:MAG: molecular chaperone DnaJ [Rhizorhabdus sp.]|nr:molecular chaperone DnaJ [Rhizorhabdus sp.]
MTLLALAVGGLLLWMWRRGELKSFRINDVLTVASGLAGLWTLFRGEALTGVLLLAVAGIWYATRNKPMRFARAPRSPRPPATTMRLDEAQRVLDVPAGADAETIRAAHRRLVARVHPDHGGSAELAARVNAARDMLLAELAPRSRR